MFGSTEEKMKIDVEVADITQQQVIGAIAAELDDCTAAGVGIPRRRPRLTAQQCALVRHQLEHGGCLAAFDAGIHGIRDAINPDVAIVRLVQTDDPDAVPGLRP